MAERIQLYRWCVCAAVHSCRKSLDFITGWLSALGWQSGVASNAYVGTLSALERASQR